MSVCFSSARRQFVDSVFIWPFSLHFHFHCLINWKILRFFMQFQQKRNQRNQIIKKIKSKLKLKLWKNGVIQSEHLLRWQIGFLCSLNKIKAFRKRNKKQKYRIDFDDVGDQWSIHNGFYAFGRSLEFSINEANVVSHNHRWAHRRRVISHLSSLILIS